MAEEPIRKDDIIDVEGVKAGLNEVIKLLGLVIQLQDQLVEKGKSMVNPLGNLNASAKEDQVAIAAYSKEVDGLVASKKNLVDTETKLDKLQKQLNATLKDSAYREAELKGAIRDNNKVNADQVRYNNAAEGSLEKLRIELNRIELAYTKAGAAQRSKLAPELKKTRGEVDKLEQSMGKYQRNVGNYPKLTGAITTGFNDLTSAIGGTTANIGNAITQFATAGGALGIFAALVGALAMAWKNVKENVDLYLTSADKLRYGFAGYSKDAEKEREATLKRAEGQLSTARAALSEAAKALNFKDITEEQREQYKLQMQQAELMLKEGAALRNSVMSEKKRVEWKLKYNRLLQEEETISDEKLIKETEWEGLEAEFIKQRVIVSDQESTIAQKKQAAIDADIIADKLVKDKTEFLNKQIDNMTALSEMTGTQEVVEDSINGLLKERNTIQKEYYSNQVRINRLEKSGQLSSGGVVNKPVNINRDAISQIEIIKAATIETNQIAEAGFIDRSEWYQNQVRLVKDAAAQELEIERQKEREKQEIYAATFAVVDSLQTIVSNNLQRQMRDELRRAGDNAAERERINEEYGKKQKDWSITMAVINGALAVTQAWANETSWVAALARSIVAIATVAAEISTISSQEFAHGGSGVLGGNVHASGGVRIPGFGVAEAGEHLAVTSRAMTSRYGANTLDAISNSINQGKFFEVWGNAERSMNDPFTKKMYELMLNTPSIYTDSHGNTIKQYPNGRTVVIKRLYLN